jgi:DNA-binding LacI/PurR family transcriptional regulator
MERRVPKSTATIYEVARHAAVSIATVSRVHRGTGPVAADTRARVIRSIEQLEYRPSHSARSLAAGEHGATAIVFPDLSGPYFSEVIYGFERAVAAEQSVMILGTHGRERADELVADLAGRVDGLVIMGRTVSDRLVGSIVARGVPVVMLARPAIEGVDSVRSENRHVAAALAGHLFEHGWTDQAFIGDPTSSSDASDRWLGLLDAHRASGRPVPRAPTPTEYTEVAGYASAMRLLTEGVEAASTGAPTRRALVCANDQIAIGALRAARDLGISVPEHVAITGWDDIPAAGLVSPALTTVRQPIRQLGSTAAELLTELLNGRRAPRHVLLPSELVIRASCGPHLD